MDNRLKKLLVNAVINECFNDSPFDGASKSAFSIAARIKDTLEQVDENTFLYIAGLVDVPAVGEHWRIVRNNVFYDGFVSAVNYIEATFTVTYLVPETFYFTTAENAKTYATTGDRGACSNWSRSKNDEHQYPGEYDVKRHSYISFQEL